MTARPLAIAMREDRGSDGVSPLPLRRATQRLCETLGRCRPQETIARISQLTPSDLADDVVAAVRELGGEAKRVEIIDRALELGGSTEEERSVVSWYTGAARTYHLRTLADYAVTVCKDRRQLVEGGSPGRRRVAEASRIEPHRFGRVFTASVGVGDDPGGVPAARPAATGRVVVSRHDDPGRA